MWNVTAGGQEGCWERCRVKKKKSLASKHEPRTSRASKGSTRARRGGGAVES